MGWRYICKCSSTTTIQLRHHVTCEEDETVELQIKSKKLQGVVAECLCTLLYAIYIIKKEREREKDLSLADPADRCMGVFTFSSSGLCTGDPDPALSKSTQPLAHTSLITWKT